MPIDKKKFEQWTPIDRSLEETPTAAVAPVANKTNKADEPNKTATASASTDFVDGKGLTAIGEGDDGQPIFVAGSDNEQSDDGQTTPEIRGRDRQIKTYKDMLERLNAPETLEQKLMREKREKARGLIKSVGDGLSALSNIVVTREYSPEIYEGKRSQASAYEQRLEKAKAERKADEDRYYNFALKLGDLEALKDKEARDAALAQQAADREQIKFNAWLRSLPYEERLKIAKADKAVQDAAYARAKAENAQDYFKNQNENEKKKGRLYDSQANKNYQEGQASMIRAGKAGGSKEDVVHHFNGKVYRGKTMDYAKDVMKAVGEWNEEHPEDHDQIETYHEENTMYGTTRKPRKIEDLAAEYERRSGLKEDSDNMTMPGVGG